MKLWGLQSREQRNHKWLALGLAVALAFCSTAHADQREQTIGFDWRNTPNWKAAVDSGWGAVCIWPRAQTARSGWAGDSLKAHGLKVYLGHQPWAATWQGSPIKDWPMDARMWSICEPESLWLRDSTGAVVVVAQWDISPSYIPDFRIPNVRMAWARMLASYWPNADGWYFDYGDLVHGLSWEPSCKKVRAADMEAWASGYRDMVRQLLMLRPAMRIACWCRPMDATLCGLWPFEGVGPYYQNLYSYERVLTEYRAIRRQGGRGLLLCQRNDVPQYRRVMAGVALLTDAWFTWRHPGGATDRSFRDLEHFELDLGTASDTCWEREPQVWQRMWTRGIVLANVSTTKWFTYQRNATTSYRIGPGDAIVIQTRDKTGRFIPWRTNYAR